jgi:hypothetical protein
MIPSFGSVTGYLPHGQHRATWDELKAGLGFSPERQALLVGLLAACRALRLAGVKEVWIGGSFSTKKKKPNDYDGCYSMTGVDPDKLDPVFLKLRPPRDEMKKKYMGELLPAEFAADTLGSPYSDYFQKDKNGRKKGIVVLDLTTLP